MNLMRAFIIIVIGVGLLTSCNSNSAKNHTAKDETDKTRLSQKFKDYWYSGKAELSSYQLNQARYGQQNPEEAVMIFVTEDFLTDQQVKHEQGKGKEATNVMKLNKIKRFHTGMYDYSMMMSVFTPVHHNQYPHSLKVTTSAQDWCGHAYLQMNNRDGQYHWRGFSYFQDEVHEDYHTDTTWLEDEVWTRLRLAPETLPEGEVKMIPGSMFKRLRHRKLDPEKAVVERRSVEMEKGENQSVPADAMVYKINYPEIERTLSIFYEKAFPHKIYGWIDKHKSGFGDNTKQLKTTAWLRETVRTDYWNKNSLTDSTWRKRLKINDFRK